MRLIATAVIVCLTPLPLAEASTYSTPNFVVTAASPRIARQIADAAEQHRSELAQRWFDKRLPDWKTRCRVTLRRDTGVETGWTSYLVSDQQVKALHITLRGPVDRIRETVLPHEVTHAVLISSIGRPLPRWADEGVAVMSESESQRMRLRCLADQFLNSGQMLPLERILDLDDYPDDRNHLHTFYAGSYALTEFLVAEGGSARLLEFAGEGREAGWNAAIQRHYDFADTASLESAWKSWLQRKVEPPLHVASHD